MIRWVCEQCGKGALGPTRPRIRDVVRYCFPCSTKAGVLVDRKAPSLERKRTTRKETEQQKKIARRARTIAERARAREAAAQRWIVAGEDVRKIAAQCWTALLAAARQLTKRDASRPALPEIVLRRSATHPKQSSGHAWGTRRIAMTLGRDVDRASVKELTLHELGHCMRVHFFGDATGRQDGAHGRTFNRLLWLAARKLWRLDVAFAPTGYEMSRRIERALRRLDAQGPEETPKCPGCGWTIDCGPTDPSVCQFGSGCWCRGDAEPFELQLPDTGDDPANVVEESEPAHAMTR